MKWYQLILLWTITLVMFATIGHVDDLEHRIAALEQSQISH